MNMKISGGERVWACGPRQRWEKFVQKFGKKTREVYRLEDLGVDGGYNAKIYLKE